VESVLYLLSKKCLYSRRKYLFEGILCDDFPFFGDDTESIYLMKTFMVGSIELIEYLIRFSVLQARFDSRDNSTTLPKYGV
jgi:hypothetical protein